LFLEEKTEIYMKHNKKITQDEILHMATETWMHMSNEEKQEYERMAQYK
jgi:hypothetical protein